VALLKRLNCAGEWFRWMAEELLSSWICKKDEANRGLKTLSRPIRVVDATCIREVGSTGTDWRVHYSFNLNELECCQYLVTDRSW